MLDILGWLEDEDIEWMTANGQCYTAEMGQVVVEKGAVGVRLYVVLDGELMVEKGPWEPLAELHPGDVIGELSLLDNGPASATVRAAVKTTLLGIPMGTMVAKIETDDPFGKRFYWAVAEFLANRMRRTLLHFSAGAVGYEASSCDPGRRGWLLDAMAGAPLAGPLEG
jgi:CRP-like cAMP-binding protein